MLGKRQEMEQTNERIEDSVNEQKIQRELNDSELRSSSKNNIKLLFVTGNIGKQKEFQAIIQKINNEHPESKIQLNALFYKPEQDINEIQHESHDVILDTKLKEVMRLLVITGKAQEYSDQGVDYVVCEDTALHFGMFGFKGGQYVKHLLNKDNINNFAYMIEMSAIALNDSAEQQTDLDKVRAECIFGVSKICINDKDIDRMVIRNYTGMIDGKICQPEGSNGFGWDPIFYTCFRDKSENKNCYKTIAQATDEEKLDLSFRYKALSDLFKDLESTIIPIISND